MLARYQLALLEQSPSVVFLKCVLQRQALRFTPSWAEKLSNVKKLNGHDGCVNRLAWSEDGSLLASGSDDRQVASHLCLAKRACRHSVY